MVNFGGINVKNAKNQNFLRQQKGAQALYEVPKLKPWYKDVFL